jgi:hypothetical protein
MEIADVHEPLADALPPVPHVMSWIGASRVAGGADWEPRRRRRE